MVNDNTPILIGTGLTLQKEKDVKKLKSPLALLTQAAEAALRDAGGAVKKNIDTVAGIRFVTDSPEGANLPIGRYNNIGLSVARDLDLAPTQALVAATGGNSPQMMINELAERISKGAVGTALLVGGEGLGSIMRVLGQGLDFSDKQGWNEQIEGPREEVGVEKNGCLPVERRHGLYYPVNYYPIFENALRHHLGRDMPTHMQKLGEMMQPFTEIAAHNPYSWFPVARSAREISTVTDTNRLVGYPYPKYMNSVIRVDQAAAVVLTSVGKAREMGVEDSHWVYLHGCAEANDIWNPIERPELHRSHAMKGMAELALDMAGWRVADIDYFDLYSCFPVAVEVACREMNIAEDDERPFTITGGLPYFGGAGNAYTLLSVAQMAQKLRANPGSKGFCNGNGWFLTKHSLGLYSTEPFEGDWQREAPSVLQGKIDAMGKMTVEETPDGIGTIESYTVSHVAGKPPEGILIGRMEATGHRFCAHMTHEGEHVQELMRQDAIGMRGTLTSADGINTFTPAA
jgi:acetyl-CoA C-acetyltransferase